MKRAWLVDSRKELEDWVRAYTAEEAIALLVGSICGATSAFIYNQYLTPPSAGGWSFRSD